MHIAQARSLHQVLDISWGVVGGVRVGVGIVGKRASIVLAARLARERGEALTAPSATQP